MAASLQMQTAIEQDEGEGVVSRPQVGYSLATHEANTVM